MVSESIYADYVEEFFTHKFPEATIKREVETDSGRFCDILIDTEPLTLAVEVENTAEDVVTNGVGQALLYADELDALPVVVYPDGEASGEIETLNSFCQIVHLPYPD